MSQLCSFQQNTTRNPVLCCEGVLSFPVCRDHVSHDDRIWRPLLGSLQPQSSFPSSPGSRTAEKCLMVNKRGL